MSGGQFWRLWLVAVILWLCALSFFFPDFLRSVLPPNVTVPGAVLYWWITVAASPPLVAIAIAWAWIGNIPEIPKWLHGSPEAYAKYIQRRAEGKFSSGILVVLGLLIILQILVFENRG